MEKKNNPQSSLGVTRKVQKSPQKVIDKNGNEEYVNIFLEIIGKNIIQLRGNMSQEELRKKANVSRTTISRIENGLNIELDNLIKIAEALDVHPGDLFLSEKDKTELTYKFKALMDKFVKP